MIGVQITGNVPAQARYINGEQPVAYPIFWSEVEDRRGVYDWTVPDAAIAALKAAGCTKLYLNIKMSPTWAQSVPGKPCSAPRKDTWKDLGNFFVNVHQRYSTKTCRVVAMSLWNEPDANVKELTQVVCDKYFGAFGKDRSGGYTYAQLLAQIRKQLINKLGILRPRLIGGELMCWQWSPDYWQGFVLGGGLKAADGISYHAYCRYDPELMDDGVYPTSGFSRIYDVAKLIGKTKLPLYVTETALQSDNRTPQFLDAQGQYMVYLRDVVDRDPRFAGVYWYSLYANGWMNTSLIVGKDESQAWRVYSML